MLPVPHHLFHMSALYSHPGTCILHRTFNNSGTKPPRIHLQAVLSAASAHRLQSMSISSGVILYGLSFSYLLLFNLTDLILQNHEGKKKNHVQSHEALSKSQESASAALHDARDHWHGQFAEQGTSALQA